MGLLRRIVMAQITHASLSSVEPARHRRRRPTDVGPAGWAW
jgi:hypothetical protein